jgi:ATP-dependent protease ClpP protease subunit
VSKFTRVLYEMQMFIHARDLKSEESQTQTVYLHILSDGGDVFCGFALYDMIRTSEMNIVGVIDGRIASAATLMLMGCNIRVMGKSAFVLIHQISSAFWGTVTQFTDEHRNLSAFMKRILKIYKKHTTIPELVLDELMTKDVWLSASKCKKYSIVHHTR